MKAFLKDRQMIADGTLAATFQLAVPPAQFTPGQFLVVELINPPYRDDKGLQRYFSITNLPNNQGELTIATRLRDSAFKKSLAEMPLGSPVEIKSISGEFILPADSRVPLAFVTGGIGITPFMSMIRQATDKAYLHQITLLYFNRNRQSAAFIDELQELAKQNRNLNLILIMTEDNGWQGETRKASPELVKQYLPQWQSTRFMVAGPAGMVEEVSQTLYNMGVARENVITENFAGY